MRVVFEELDRDGFSGLMEETGYLSLGRGQDMAELSFIRPINSLRFHILVRFDQGRGAHLEIHIDEEIHKSIYEDIRIEEEIERIESYI